MTRQLTQGMLKMTGVMEGPGEEPEMITHLAKSFKSFWGDQFADLTPIIDPTIIEKLALERDNLKASKAIRIFPCQFDHSEFSRLWSRVVSD